MAYLKSSVLLALIIITGCSMFGPKPSVVYNRPDIVVPSDTKVIVLPTMDWSGSTSNISKSVESSIVTGWGNLYGSTNVIPAGPVVSELAKKAGVNLSTVVNALDNTSSVEQFTNNNPGFKKFVKLLTSKFGNYDMALALFHGNDSMYDSKETVRVHLGHFNTKNMTWKWITKIEDKKGMWGNWNAAYTTMISNSFDKVHELHMPPPPPTQAERAVASEKTTH